MSCHSGAVHSVSKMKINQSHASVVAWNAVSEILGEIGCINRTSSSRFLVHMDHDACNYYNKARRIDQTKHDINNNLSRYSKSRLI